ncbi:hypothetical protein NUACC21_64160 [Scytonema sp. NUACC21]
MFGFILAWILVSYEFPGKRLADGLVDLPFAMPAVVAGIALAVLTLIGQELLRTADKPRASVVSKVFNQKN